VCNCIGSPCSMPLCFPEGVSINEKSVNKEVVELVWVRRNHTDDSLFMYMIYAYAYYIMVLLMLIKE
jgi:hypothetical protein